MDITREDAAWDEPEETREIPPVQAPGSWDYAADVVIVGGGGRVCVRRRFATVPA